MAVPSRHGSRLDALHVGVRREHNVSLPQRPADQNNFQFPQQRPGKRLGGNRKYTPVELISRVTRVIGNSSATWSTLRNLRGSFSVARGYSRSSGSTPTA